MMDVSARGQYFLNVQLPVWEITQNTVELIMALGMLPWHNKSQQMWIRQQYNRN